MAGNRSDLLELLQYVLASDLLLELYKVCRKR